jgi:hypothetical protein
MCKVSLIMCLKFRFGQRCSIVRISEKGTDDKYQLEPTVCGVPQLDFKKRKNWNIF